jgi:hypothetical protein
MEIVLIYDPATTDVSNEPVFIEEKKVLEQVREASGFVFTVQQVMALRYCLLARRLDLLLRHTKAPFRPLIQLLPSNCIIDI